MTSSGSLGHIYFAQVPERLSLEQLAIAYPGLIEALVAHEGIGLVMVRSETRGAIVHGQAGRPRAGRATTSRRVRTRWPTSARTRGASSADLASYANSGDIIVNGTYDPSTGQVISMDDLVGAHGGVGGMQTQPFVVYPSDWTDDEPELSARPRSTSSCVGTLSARSRARTGQRSTPQLAGEVGAT